MPHPKLKPGQVETEGFLKSLAINDIRKLQKSYPSMKTSLEVLTFLEKHCKQALTAMLATKRFLYTGMSGKWPGKGKLISLARSRDNRKPVDTEKPIQEFVDNILRTQGFRALRSNSKFVTSDSDQADTYGDIYLVFPIDGFDYTWSRKNDDWVIDDDDVEEWTPDLKNFNRAINVFGKKIKAFLQTVEKKPNHRIPKQYITLLQKIGLICFGRMEWVYSIPVNEKPWAGLSWFRYAKKVQECLALYDQYIQENPKLALITSNERKAIDQAIKQASDLKVWGENCREVEEIYRTHLEAAIRTGFEIWIHGSYLLIRDTSEGHGRSIEIPKPHDLLIWLLYKYIS